MEDDRPTAARVDQEEAEEDALPDWSRFAAFAKSNREKSEGAVLVPFIPKRGEKDFEPLAAADAFPPSSKEAKLSQHQRNLLQDSRNALYTALSSGSRHHSSKGHNSFTWRPDLDGGRAVCDSGNAAYGVHFSNIGHFNQKRKTLELLPEEAVYMVERGAIELWKDSGNGVRVPMSVQQAWSELLGHDEMTPERYQVYAFLRRLGYVVIRARPVTGAERIVTTKKLPLYRILINSALRPLVRLRDSVLRLASTLRSYLVGSHVQRIRYSVTRALRQGEGRLSGLLGGRGWASYDSMFAHLQIIPSGHDRPLPRGPLPHSPSTLTPLDKPVQSADEPSAVSQLPSLQEYPYQTFYHVYKPVTKYKKSDPPEPDFRLVIVNAATTPMPDLFEFSAMFDSTPMPPPPPPPGSGPSRPPRAQPNRPVRQDTTPSAPSPTRTQAVLASLPLIPRLFPSLVAPAAPARQIRKPTPYPRLKTGRRTILVAVVDNGTSSLLRFSETEFAKIPWIGTPRSA
ncbi:hypothetical protein BMF94_2179 [Rhodotorula taiwanensis]|uniref:tRNA-splicing endonuclease subunit Sen54 N-terminal domain-containing protein n=1 Tax=Rhodotorula taiwanensis TaxID=741276 RepID=A0A2S5BD60_9BASI|nr:hypothetical protein BMF94_2179 [Rhodotorula taiwanensis]